MSANALIRYTTALLAFCVSVAWPVAQAKSAADPATCQVDPADKTFGKPSWYGLYWDKAKAGYLWTLARIADDGQMQIDYKISITIGGVENLTTESRRYAATAPHRLLGGSLLSDGQTINYRADGDGLQLQTDGRTLNWPELDWQLCDEGFLSIRRALEQALEPGDRFSTRYLDVKAMTVVDEHHTIEQVETLPVQGVDHRFQTLLTRARIEGMDTRYRQRFRDGDAVTIFLGQLEARLETEAQAKGPVQDIEALDVMTFPVNTTLALDRVFDISTLRIKVRIDDSLTRIQEAVRNGTMQTVRYLDDKTALITIGEAASVTGHEDASERQPVSDFLIANLVYPADHPRIKTLADDIAARLPAGASPLEHARAILHFSAAYLRYELTASATVLETLDSRIGDCTEYARLFVTLARASGFPAREVSGFIYTGTDTRGEFGGHAWAEIFVDGKWQPMDPTSNQVTPDKTHVQFSNFLVSGLNFEISGVDYKQR